MRRALLVLAVALGALGFGVSNALAKNLVVDKDKVQCPNAQYTSIQTAVTAAAPGDMVEVCPDTYNESVNVPKTLDIVAQSKTKLNTEDNCLAATPAPPDPTNDAIVQGAPSFNLQANDIRLEGFVIQNSPNLGVNTSSSFSGYQILSNLVQNYGVAGINLLSGGAKQSRVSDNCLRSAFSDTVAHEGMESEVGPLLKNARADHNVGTGNDVFIDASGAGMRMNVAFDHNKSMGNNIGFLISNSTDSSIDHNSSQGDGNGVNMGGSNNGLKTTHNSVVSSQGSGITLSNSNSVPTFTGPNTGVEISHNSVTDSARGIRILADSTFVNSEIGHNDTFANALFGILLEAGDSNTIDHNSANDNGDTGIYNQTGSGNLFLNNSMFGNGVFDARDDNRASNTWSGNHCNTDSPPGTICGV